MVETTASSSRNAASQPIKFVNILLHCVLILCSVLLTLVCLDVSDHLSLKSGNVSELTKSQGNVGRKLREGKPFTVCFKFGATAVFSRQTVAGHIVSLVTEYMLDVRNTVWTGVP